MYDKEASMEKINFLPYYVLSDNVENPHGLLSRVDRVDCGLVKSLLYTGSDLWVLRLL